MELWKEIEGFNKRYFISNKGKIRSEYTYRYNKRTKKVEKVVRTKFLKQTTDRQGYKVVSLYNNNFKKTYKVHRLVANAFILNLNNLLVVNHIDENKINNDVTNLEWCTQKDNVLHSIHKLLQKRKIIRSDGKVFNSITQAMKEMKLKSNHISDVCNGKRKSTGGYTFKYEEENYGI